MISSHRKLELLQILQSTLLIELPEGIFGNDSLAQEMSNRIESMCKTQDEYRFSVDAVVKLLELSKGKEIQLVGKRGRTYSRIELAKEFGIFLAPKQKKARD